MPRLKGRLVRIRHWHGALALGIWHWHLGPNSPIPNAKCRMPPCSLLPILCYCFLLPVSVSVACYLLKGAK